MKRNGFRRAMAILLCMVMVCPWFCVEQPVEAATDTGGISTYLSDFGFKGKTISILGDSISTFEDYSQGDAADTTNSTIRNNYCYYWLSSSYGVGLNDTWWRQTASVLGMDVLVNNSYSGSRVYLTEFGTAGAYVSRSQQLHDDTGSNAGQEPDIIVVYMGTNDTKNADDPGDVSAIDYAKLKTVSSSYTPASVLEAYALMVYRAKVRYPNAEIYCSTLIPYEDISVAHVRVLKKFNEGVKEIAKNLDLYVIDLYNDSGLTSQSENFDYHMANTLHPSAYGMDCITNCVVSSLLENSKYNTKKSSLHSVSYDLKDIFIKQGKTMHAVDGKALTLKLGGVSGANMNVKVTMGGVDITSSCYSNGTISISKVTGDITVKAVTDTFNKSVKSYRWELINNQMRSVNDDGAYYNPTSFTAGSCSGSVFSSARIGLGETVVLRHNKPWAVEWKSTGTWGAGTLIMSGADNGLTAGNTYIFRRTGSSLLALGYCDGSSYHNYGVDLSAYGITDTTHVFRLVNEVSDDGSNMVYLYVDGKKIAPMNNYYIGSTSQNTTVDDLNGMDITFKSMGTVNHPLNKCTLDYIQVWEDGIPEEIVTNDYRWETVNGSLTSIENDDFIANNATLKAGSIASDGKLSGTYFQLDKGVVLLHNKPWSVEWKSSGSWLDKSEGALLLASSATTAALYGSYLYRKSGSDIFVFGERDSSAYQNYGLSLADFGIDGTAEHVYRLVNRVNDDGSNMVYLFVDGVELGAMNQYFVNGTAQGTTSDWVNGRDFTFEYFGTPQFPIGNCYIEYMQIDEGCSHEEIQWNAPVEPTCTEDGSKTGICAECDREFVEVIPATGHSYELTIHDATCSQYAIYEYICGNCGDSYQMDAGEMTDWMDSIPEGMDADLFESKTQYRYSDYDSLTSYETSMEGYTLKSSAWEKSGTGTVNYVSSWPSGFSTSNSLYTKYNNKSKKVTASETTTTKTTINSDSVVGYLYYHWCYSGSSYSTSYKTGSYTTFHAYYSTTAPSNYTCDTSDYSYKTSSSTCSNSGWFFVTNVYAQKYTTYKKLFTYERWSEMTQWSDTQVEAATNRKIETRTLYRLKDAGLAEHTYDDGVVTAAPSCASEGVMTYTCQTCGDYYTEAIPVTSHNYQGVVTAPTCTVDGYTTYTCTDCGDSYTADAVAALGHSYKSKVVGPTCTMDGYYLYTCSTCGDSYIGDSITTPGHKYEATVTAPTCTEDGYTTYICFVCDDSYTADIVEASGHTWTDATCTDAKTCETCGATEGDALGHSYDAVVTAPTCTEDGYTTYTCTACGDSYTADVVAATGHIWTDATCTDAKTCETCGATEGDALGHSYEAVVTAPTCTEDGYTTYTCTSCGDRYADDVVAATGHIWMDATCTDAKTCETCGATEGDALGHSYDAVVTAPTCTEDGYTTYTCTACGDSYTADVVAATGHIWTDATCTDAKTCETCGATEGDALGHSYDAVVTAPTCTEDGYTTYTCASCGNSYVGDTVAAEGHSYEAGFCTACGAKDPDYVALVIPTLTLKYPTLSFEAEILYNVYYTVDDATSIVEMGLMTFATREDDANVDTAMEIIPGFVNSASTYMARSNGIPAKNLADTVYFKVYAKLTDGTYVYSQIAGYNGVAYANTIFNNAKSTNEIKALMVAMLNYGAEAQMYFGYKTDSLMNAGLTEEQLALVQPYDESMIDDVISVDSNKAGSFVLDQTAFTQIYPSVSFDGAFSINYYFGNALTADDGMMFYVWDLDTYLNADQLTVENATTSMNMVQSGSRFWGEVSGIAAKEIGETVFVSGVYTSNGVTYSTGIIAYSLGKYCKTIAANDSSDAQLLGAATAVYGYYAENYFAQFG